MAMRALILNAEQKTAAVQQVPRPRPGPGEVLIRVEAVALNPVDATYVMHPLGATGRTVGSDFSGTVVELGPMPTPNNNNNNNNILAIGQRVAGFLQGACSANDRPGAFAEYLTCAADLVWRVPDSITLEQAAAVSLCALTAAQMVFYRLGLPAPFAWSKGTEADDDKTKPLTVFIYGASTSVGMYAAQLVRRSVQASGRTLTLLGAASPPRFPLLQTAYGYDALVDYRAADWAEQVRALASGGVDFAVDCIATGSTVQCVCSTLRQNPGDRPRVAVVRSRQSKAWDGAELPTEPVYGAVWEGLGADVQYHSGIVVRASENARRFAAAFYKWLAGAVGSELAPSPVRRMPGGLDRVVPDGLALMGPGPVQRSEEWMKPVSAEKLVYSVQSNP
ncbi:chaperonin 10-like protein [Lasiosphaeria ovina]|uniref:Chaperonin 10-like protein n=1 Tax=Lasiosphaeria ovina TaxID=92902 RepID=A0AAE0K7A1_9PEZI|nr:chaperonin 10-like protein [Lasiosphaeria ovina]